MDQLHPPIAARAERLHMLRFTSDAGAVLTEPAVFSAAAPDVLRCITLDSMTAIYDRRSGMTHVVAPVVPIILAALGMQSLSLDLLAQQLDVANQRDALLERLEELVATGLVDRV